MRRNPSNTNPNPNLFERPKETDSSWEILKGQFLDFPPPEKPYDFRFHTTSFTFLKVYGLFLLFSTALWLILSFVVAYIDVPNLYFHLYDQDFLQTWQSMKTTTSKWQFLIQENWTALVRSYLGGLLMGFISIPLLEMGLRIILPYSFALAFGGTLGFGLGGGLAESAALGIAFGATVSLDIYLVKIDIKMVSIGSSLFGGILLFFALSLAFGFLEAFVFAMSLMVVMILLVEFSAAFVVSTFGSLILYGLGSSSLGLLFDWNMAFFCFGTYLFVQIFQITAYFLYYQFDSLFHTTLDNNAYLKCARLRIPIWGLKQKLVKEAFKKPELARKFISFLGRFRPLQKDLIAALIHPCNGGLLRQNPMQFQNLFLLTIPPNYLQYQVSKKWLEGLLTTRAALFNVQKKKGLDKQMQHWRKFIQALNDWKKINSKENPKWNFYYFPFFKEWEKAALLEMENLQGIWRKTPYFRSVVYTNKSYSKSKDELDRRLFLSREKQLQNLVSRLRKGRTEPLILIQGQKGVGKTSFLQSLIKTLKQYDFQILYQDLHSIQNVNFNQWTENFYWQTNHCLGIEGKIDWRVHTTETRSLLTDYLNDLPLNKTKQLIVVFDRYESVYQSSEKEMWKLNDLLESLQNHLSSKKHPITFLFTGTSFLTDTSPHKWSSFFQKAETVELGYLNKKDSIEVFSKLIPSFLLQYHTAIPDQIYELTQGHPALLQAMAQGLIDLASQKNKVYLDIEDLEELVWDIIFKADFEPIATFWNSFCHPKRHPHARKMVQEVLHKQSISHPTELERLLKHGYVVEIEEDKGYTYKIRVPLFERWIRQHEIDE